MAMATARCTCGKVNFSSVPDRLTVPTTHWRKIAGPETGPWEDVLKPGAGTKQLVCLNCKRKKKHPFVGAGAVVAYRIAPKAGGTVAQIVTTSATTASGLVIRLRGQGSVAKTSYVLAVTEVTDLAVLPELQAELTGALDASDKIYEVDIPGTLPEGYYGLHYADLLLGSRQLICEIEYGEGHEAVVEPPVEPGTGVASFKGRTGDVVAAADDYTTDTVHHNGATPLTAGLDAAWAQVSQVATFGPGSDLEANENWIVYGDGSTYPDLALVRKLQGQPVAYFVDELPADGNEFIFSVAQGWVPESKYTGGG